MLKIHFKDQRQPPIWVIEKRYTIGTAGDNHLCVDDDSLDALHARLLTVKNSLYLKDNNSHQGCYVNGQRITEKELLPGDTIRLGNVEFDILDPHEGSHSYTSDSDSDHKAPYHNDPDQSASEDRRWLLIADSGTLFGQEFPIRSQSCTIGRGSDCDISIPASQLARQHAEFTLQENQLWIRDLGSSSGVYLNDERVQEGIIQSGDKIRLDVYRFQAIGPDTGERKRRTPPSPQRVEKKPIDTSAKQWITKPTSPGNRIEPESRGRNPVPWLLTLLLCGALAGMLIYLLRSFTA
ncbi:FHA domain-containing protein [Pseudomaricurvus sp.]|uniref:FHA domain-containing protein n=1 Tax=Pseudomaricurvus sp. TaxID=2004510 RepID=UPI003F6A9FD9